MKISWGYKIAAVYICFVCGILFLVFKASGQQFDLVTDDYYEQELKFQNVIDAQKNVSALSGPPVYRVTPGTVQVLLPAEFEGAAWKGSLYLYRPSDAQLDLRKAFTGNGRAYAWVLSKELKGNYTIKFSWECKGKKFFDEKSIVF